MNFVNPDATEVSNVPVSQDGRDYFVPSQYVILSVHHIKVIAIYRENVNVSLVGMDPSVKHVL